MTGENIENKQIAFLVTGLQSGGIENYLLRFLEFVDVKIKAMVYCKSNKLGDLEQEYIRAGAELKPFKMGMFSISDYIRLYKEFKKKDYDAVVDFTGNFAAFPLLIAKKAGIRKRIAFYRGSTNHFKEDLFRLTYNGFINKLIPKVSTSILFNSEAAFDFFFRDKWKNDNRFQIIYNGVNALKFDVGNQNLRQQFNIPENAFVIGHTGRFNSAKNHKTIIEVAQKLIKKYPDIYIVLCGNGVKAGLEKKIEEFEIGTNVRLFNNRKDIPIFLNTMNAYFFPSITEGQPNALIEAMIMGLPFVASNIPSIKETVEGDSELYEPFNVEGFAKALERLYLKKVEKNMGLKKRTIERFDHNERFKEFYHHLI